MDTEVGQARGRADRTPSALGDQHDRGWPHGCQFAINDNLADAALGHDEYVDLAVDMIADFIPGANGHQIGIDLWASERPNHAAGTHYATPPRSATSACPGAKR